MKIDRIYIDEAIRIRKSYLYNLSNIVEKESDINFYFNKIKEIGKKYENYEHNVDEKEILKTMLEINKHIDKIKNHMLPFNDNIKKLDEDQRLLYNNIKDKYPKLSDDEIQNQIVPHIIPVDDLFRMENEDLYNKIIEKDKL